jgi:hypothetical protein
MIEDAKYAGLDSNTLAAAVSSEHGLRVLANHGRMVRQRDGMRSALKAKR